MIQGPNPDMHLDIWLSVTIQTAAVLKNSIIHAGGGGGGGGGDEVSKIGTLSDLIHALLSESHKVVLIHYRYLQLFCILLCSHFTKFLFESHQLTI